MLVKPRNSLVALIVLLAAGALLAGEALACFSPGPPFKPDENAQKIMIPKPSLSVDKIERGGGTPNVSGTCDIYGKIWIEVNPALDNVGYEFEIVEGEGSNPPGGFELPDPQLPPAGQNLFILHWDDGNTEKQEPFKMKIRVKTYAPNGDEGPVSEPIEVAHPGRE